MNMVVSVSYTDERGTVEVERPTAVGCGSVMAWIRDAVRHHTGLSVDEKGFDKPIRPGSLDVKSGGALYTFTWG